MHAPRPQHTSTRIVLVAVVLTAAHLSCHSSRVWIEERGETSYEPGLPYFDMKVVPSWIGGRYGADVRLAVDPESLHYIRTGMGFRGGYDVLVRVFDRRERLISEAAFTDTLELDRTDSTLRDDPITWERRLEIGSGHHVVQVILVDAAGGGQSTKVARVWIPGHDEAHLSEPIIEGIRPDGRPIQFLSPFIPSSVDSLRASVQFAAPRSEPVEMSVRLLWVARDTSISNPPYWVGPGYNTLQFRGMAPQDVDTVQSNTRTLDHLETEVTISVDLPRLAEGVYRLEFDAVSRGGSALRKSGMFTVAPPGFPRVQTIDQMVDALHYIAYEGEIRQIRQGATQEDRRARFDSFWGSLVSRRMVAANLLESYYSRIEEANLRYSSYKEGWKTDRGMVFVLLGAPLRVDLRRDVEVWRFSFSDDAANTFVFDRVVVPDTDSRYDNFVLRRRPYYEHVWAQAMDRWRRGIIL